MKRGKCQDGNCACIPGWEGESCSVKTCLNNCSTVGHCVEGVCFCPLGYSGDDCSVFEDCFKKCFHGFCVGVDGSWPCECVGNEWKGQYCSEPAYICSGNCSGYGVCDESTKKCVCNPNYKGDDCSEFYGCRVDTDCTQNKICTFDSDNTGTCNCPSGKTGDDCSITSHHEISPILIAGVVLAGAVVVLLAVYFVWKSWSGRESNTFFPDNISSMEGGGMTRSLVGGENRGGYSRIPRRLIK